MATIFGSKPADKVPFLIIASNSEKNLPAAFLRRCIYYDLPFPAEDGRLEAIVASRLRQFRGLKSSLLAEGIEFFRYLRDGEAGLQKFPATAGLLDWLIYLSQRGAHLEKGLRKQERLVKPSLVTLLKHEQDQKRSGELWNGWLTRTV